MASVAELAAIGQSMAKQDLGAQKLSRTFLSGQYASHFRGRGMDYLESRPYTDGDDIRSIDWRVTARSGKLHTKVYVEERDRPIIILGHFPDSMYFGTRTVFKSVLAAKIGAIMAYSGIKRGDRIGCLIHSQKNSFDIRPKGGRGNAMRVLHSLSQATHFTPEYPGLDVSEAGGAKPLNKLLEQACRSVPTGSMIILLSDFYDEINAYKKSLFRLAQHADIIGFHCFDPLEVQLPVDLNIPLSDGKRKTLINSNKALHDKQKQQFTQQCKQLKSLFEKMGQALVHVRTDQDLLGILAGQEINRRKQSKRSKQPTVSR